MSAGRADGDAVTYEVVVAAPPDEVFLPPGWRDVQAAREPAERRLEAARRAGLAVLVERLRYQWTPAKGLPPRGDRLRLRPLAEATAFPAGQGARRIRADTDVANAPMAAAFGRAGYDQFAIRIDLVAAG